jgi:hypothetical protein
MGDTRLWEMHTRERYTYGMAFERHAYERRVYEMVAYETA